MTSTGSRSVRFSTTRNLVNWSRAYTHTATMASTARARNLTLGALAVVAVLVGSGKARVVRRGGGPVGLCRRRGGLGADHVVRVEFAQLALDVALQLEAVLALEVAKFFDLALELLALGLELL